MAEGYMKARSVFWLLGLLGTFLLSVMVIRALVRPSGESPVIVPARSESSELDRIEPPAPDIPTPAESDGGAEGASKFEPQTTPEAPSSRPERAPFPSTNEAVKLIQRLLKTCKDPDAIRHYEIVLGLHNAQLLTSLASTPGSVSEKRAAIEDLLKYYREWPVEGQAILSIVNHKLLTDPSEEVRSQGGSLFLLPYEESFSTFVQLLTTDPSSIVRRAMLDSCKQYVGDLNTWAKWLNVHSEPSVTSTGVSRPAMGLESARELAQKRKRIIGEMLIHVPKGDAELMRDVEALLIQLRR